MVNFIHCARSFGVNILGFLDMKTGSERAKRDPLPWDFIVKFVGALIAVGTGALYVTGAVAHRQHLEAWSLDLGLFPKSFHELLVNGYYAYVDRIVILWIGVSKSVGKLVVAFVVLGLIGFFLASVVKSEEVAHLSRAIRRSGWKQDLIRGGLFAWMAMFGVLASLLCALTILIIPMAVGQSYGAALMQRERAQFVEGCGSKPLINTCSEVRKEGQVIARGFYIDSSQSHFAFFDVDQMQARVIERPGTELRGRVVSP